MMLSQTRRHLSWKLFLSYLVVILVGIVSSWSDLVSGDNLFVSAQVLHKCTCAFF